MNIKLIAALNRRRLRRRLAMENARLQEMRENAPQIIAAQERLVAELEGEKPTTRDIVRSVERRAKAPAFA